MSKELIPSERIERKIILLRGQRVMLDRNLAVLYGVPTKSCRAGGIGRGFEAS